VQNPRPLHCGKCAIAMVCSLLGVMALLFMDVGVIFAHRPTVFVQGQGPECKCILGVVFPSVIASSYDSTGQWKGHYGTGSWHKYWQNDPVGWSRFLDEDTLWIKTVCAMQDGAENPVEPSENPWQLPTTPSAPWWEGEEYEEWTEEAPQPDRKWEVEDFYTIAHCPCQIYIEWEGTDGNWGSYTFFCPKYWWKHPGPSINAPGLVHNVLPGEQVDITVRMVCGDCVLELTDTATMADAP